MKTMIATLAMAIIGIIFTVEESSAINKDVVLAYDFEKVQGNTVYTTPAGRPDSRFCPMNPILRRSISTSAR